MKSIRSIAPYDLKNQTPYESNATEYELRNSIGGAVYLESLHKPGFKPYEQYLNNDRAIIPDCLT
jgi:hypothetical protein